MPDAIDIDFLNNFKKLILKEVVLGKKFLIITGGGKTCRNYQKAAGELASLDQDDLDWVGIYATRFNAHFMRYVFKGFTDDSIITDPGKSGNFENPIKIGAGWKPGWSTDYDAVDSAHAIGAQTLVNLSNVDYVYDKDPKKYSDAKKLDDITWVEYRKLIPKKFSPGLNTPFDPIASELAQKHNIKVAIINGNNLRNLKNYFDNKLFQGTVIHS